MFANFKTTLLISLWYDVTLYLLLYMYLNAYVMSNALLLITDDYNVKIKFELFMRGYNKQIGSLFEYCYFNS